MPVSTGSGGNRINDSARFGTLNRIGEQPILAPDYKRADRIFSAVVVGRHVGALEKCIQKLFLRPGIAGRFGKLSPACRVKPIKPREKNPVTDRASSTGFVCSCLDFKRSSADNAANSRSSMNIRLHHSTPTAACDVGSSSLSVGSASTNFHLTCAQHPHQVTPPTLLYPS